MRAEVMNGEQWKFPTEYVQMLLGHADEKMANEYS
jgi:hypothetical protein